MPPTVPTLHDVRVPRALIAGLALVGLALGAGARWGFGRPDSAARILFIALVVTGTPLVLRTVVGLLRRRFAADVVAALAIVTAALTGETIAGLVIVLMQSGGEALEDYALHRASRSLEALLARAPKIARLVTGGGTRDIAVEAVRVDDRLAVRPGDLVPVDGVVESGRSHVDQSALTGEPAPVVAEAGVSLMSGSLNLDGGFTMRAVRPSAESQYQVIVQLVARARGERPPIQRLADRFAVWFTPATLAMCGVGWLFSQDWTVVLSVLVVATPCPLILATPVAVIAGIGRAARAGIIVKTGSAIEAIGRARVMAFDKTGTLTLGQPVVSDVLADGRPPDDLLRLAASVEQMSSHHLGAAVVAAARGRGLTLAQPAEFEEIPGLGVRGRVEGHQVMIGAPAWVGADPDGGTGTAAWVAVDGRPTGQVRFADAIRPNAPALMRRLAQLGVEHLVLLSGDRRTHAEAVGLEVGIREVRADLLPTDKVAAIRALRAAWPDQVVVMVGDGINDAPALAAASVGVAMGAHAPAASAEAADIVLLVDDVARVGDAVAIGKRTRLIALQSIGVGLGVSGLLMIVAAGGYIAPTVGALLQEALDVAVILNALRAGGAARRSGR